MKLREIIVLKGWIEVIDTAPASGLAQLSKQLQEIRAPAGTRQELQTLNFFTQGQLSEVHRYKHFRIEVTEVNANSPKLYFLNYIKRSRLQQCKDTYPYQVVHPQRAPAEKVEQPSAHSDNYSQISDEDEEF